MHGKGGRSQFTFHRSRGDVEKISRSWKKVLFMLSAESFS